MTAWSGIGDGKRPLRIGQRRVIPKTIAGVELNLDAGFAAMQRAIEENTRIEDRRFAARERCAEAWARLGLPTRRVCVRWDTQAGRTWCLVATDARGEREVWSRNEVSVEALEALATWWAQQEVIP